VIPVRLRLHNFMCYRDKVPPLDLEGIHLACLAGDNGHGKSALLDAMTWALWGKARVNRDDLLIHSGETEMEVELEFDLGPDRFRVLRKRDSRRGQSALEFQGLSGDRFLPLTEQTIRATQAKIINVLRMDYDTFINSAFLVQGRADEFTTRTPGERKRILGEILGLSMYDTYAEEAKNRARSAAKILDRYEGQLREIDRELDQEQVYQAQLEAAEQKTAALSEQVRAAETELAALTTKRQTLLHQQQLLEELKTRLRQGQRELDQIAVERKQVEAQLARYSDALAHREETEAGHVSLLQAKQESATWNVRLAARGPIIQEQHALEAAVAAAKAELLADQRAKQTQLRTLDKRVADGQSTTVSFEEKQQELVRLQERQVALTEAHQTLALSQAERSGLETQNAQLALELASTQEKLSLLQTADSADCPLCLQPLDDHHRDQVQVDLQSQVTSQRNQQRTMSESVEEIDGQTARLSGEIRSLERMLKALPAAQARLVKMQVRISQGEDAAILVRALRSELVQLQSRLQTGDYASAEQERLSSLVARLQDLHFDPTAHARARKRESELAAFERRMQELSIASEQVVGTEARIAKLQERQTYWQKSLADESARQGALEAAVVDLPQVSSALTSQSRRIDQLSTNQRQAQLRLGAARQRMDTCERLRGERKELVQARQEAGEYKAIFEELRASFGRQGVQAIIIETALPEIETEANRLLGRMTDGRMSLRLSSQRETKSGSTMETLDIFVSDELGQRNYELFSGGEAFRIDFALRIAISKMLARRAGAQLRTLFLDEGFGTQDTQGRQRLVEAINAIKGDFDRILVITHIEELKDLFPVRIDVVKGPDGSSVSMA